MPACHGSTRTRPDPTSLNIGPLPLGIGTRHSTLGSRLSAIGTAAIGNWRLAISNQRLAIGDWLSGSPHWVIWKAGRRERNAAGLTARGIPATARRRLPQPPWVTAAGLSARSAPGLLGGFTGPATPHGWCPAAGLAKKPVDKSGGEGGDRFTVDLSVCPSVPPKFPSQRP